MKKSQGTTLLELVLVIIIIGIIAGMSIAPLTQGLQSYTQSQQFNTIDWQVNTSLEQMIREIASIPSSSSITTATSSQFTFSDVNGTTMAYDLSGGNLMQNTDILASGATSLVFTYYDKTGAVTSTISSIQFVMINLAVTQNNFTYSYNTGVYLANIS